MTGLDGFYPFFFVLFSVLEDPNILTFEQIRMLNKFKFKQFSRFK
jgi:hypothetical protein